MANYLELFEQLAMMDSEQIRDLWSAFSLDFKTTLPKNPNMKSRLNIYLPTIKVSFSSTGKIELSAPSKGGDDSFMPEIRSGVSCDPDGSMAVLGSNNVGKELDGSHQNTLSIIAMEIKTLVENKPENRENTKGYIRDISVLRHRGI